VSEAKLANLVAARMARQTVLTRASAPQFFAVVDEGALRRLVGGPGVMHRQLHHLLGVAEQLHVTLRVVPLAAGAHAGLPGPFMILEFEETNLAAYRVAQGNILHAALAPAATAELITQIAA
jgi:hypothetical protein